MNASSFNVGCLAGMKVLYYAFYVLEGGGGGGLANHSLYTEYTFADLCPKTALGAESDPIWIQ